MTEFPKPCSCLAKPNCIDSRAATTHRRRRYRCPQCFKSWTTIEIIVGDFGKRTNYLAAVKDKLESEQFSKYHRIKEVLKKLFEDY
jgi:transcriptional regulator NrdR family protein